MAQIRIADVIVPVTRDSTAILSRLRKVLDFSGPTLGRLLIVDDGCADRNLAQGLAELAASDSRFQHLRCLRDMGWVEYCNRGLTERKGDAVVLNPGALVTEGWLERLAATAHSEERLALTAPLTEGDGLRSVWLSADAAPPEPISEAQFRSAVQGLPTATIIPRPSLVCNYLRGDVLDAVGLLDPTFVTPRAALDDWLMRARALGFFAKRVNHVFVSCEDAGDAQADSVEGGEDEETLNTRYSYRGGQADRFENTLDASLAAHAVRYRSTGTLKVAFDVRHLPLEMNGTKMYATSLGKALAAMPEVDLTLLAVHPLQAEGIPGRLVSPDEWADDVAVIHKPAQIFDRSHAKLLFESSAHVVVTYQDLIAYRLPHVFATEADYNAYQNTSRIMLPAVQGILVYSNNTASEIEAEFGIPREEISPVFLGVDADSFARPIVDAEQIRTRFGLSDRYFFSLATDYPHKNLASLLEAYAMFRRWWSDGEPPALALAGHATRSEASFYDQLGDRIPGVTFLGSVSNDELRFLYQHAEALVFPSLYEGFGLPPLEAMSMGTPVVAMPFSSIPEVCGDSVLYPDGLSAVDLARAMQRMATAEDLRRDLRKRGLRRIEDFHWRKTAKETFEVYRKAVLNPSPRSLQTRRSLREAISLWSVPPAPVVPEVAEAVDHESLLELPRGSSSHESLDEIPQPETPVLTVEPTVVEPEPMGVLNACQALQAALGRRIRRDLASARKTQRARLSRLKRLSLRFVQVARTDGLQAASERVIRKTKNKARHMLRRFRRFRVDRDMTCSYYQPSAPADPYVAWRRVNTRNPRRSARLRDAVESVNQPTTFSILVPVYNTPVQFLSAAIDSVLAQSYADWELILADDASTDPQVVAYLANSLPRDARVRLVRRETNGNISAATNTAAEQAQGDFLVLLDHDDVLHLDALAHLAIHIEQNPAVDLVYSDDDKLGTDGRHQDPQFKPDWSPELLLSFCYTGHLTAVRTSLYRRVGGMRLGFEGSQDHDFWLRASERAREVGHIPQLLYHWRVLPGSTAASGHEKPESFDAGRRAVAEAFARRGIACPVEQPAWALAAGCGIFQPVMPDDGPSVALLIATKNQKKLLQKLLLSLEKTTYRNYRVYVIDNESDDPETLSYLAASPHRVLRIPNPDGRFSYAAIHNQAASMVDEELVLFLNNDVEVINPRWLSQMVGWSRLPNVGSVGARLLYSDRRVQHAGIVHGLHEGLAGHAFKLLPWWDGGPMSLARVTRDCYAVTAACMLTPRKLFLEMNGFDEANFAVAYNDADYGYRLHDAGYRNVLCAEAELFHHEGATRGFGDDPREVANYRRLHGGRRDPYFNPHFDPQAESFGLRPTVVPIGSKDRPIPVLAVTHNMNWEGASRFELELMTRLKAVGAIEPTVVSPVDGPLRAEYEKAGITPQIDPSLAALFHNIGAYGEARQRTVELLARGGYEVLHANTLHGFWAVDAARAAGVASIWSIHESEPWQTYFDQFPPEIARLALSAMPSPYRVVFTAQSSAQVWKDLDFNHNFGLIRYALDADLFARDLAQDRRDEARARLGLAADEVCVLLLGTVCERKGQHDLLHAFRKIRADVAASMRCVVVGARDTLEYSRELKSKASQLDADRRDRFQIVDETGATAPYWLAADVFCCTSRIESYPHVVLEALGCGLPIVTTPVYGISEQVRPDVNSLIYQPGDVRVLTQHLETLVLDASRRRSLAAASPWVLRALPSHDEMVEQYARVFRAAAESAVEGEASQPATEPSVLSRSSGRVWASGSARGAGVANRAASQSSVNAH